jgi:peptidoglycan-N-acetylglucosamine deacetylase
LLAGGCGTDEAEARATRLHRRPPPQHPDLPPSPVPTQQHPVFTLTDYRRVVPGPAYPANAVALTIDDGPHPVWTPKILQLLEQHQVPALFCMIGNQVLGHEGVAKSVVQAGHQLANHSWSHPSDLSKLPEDRVHQEIGRAQDKIYSTTGVAPTIFRSPGGAWSPGLLESIAKARMVPLDWSDDPKDWTRPGVPTITAKLEACQAGQILLCHDGGGDRSQTYTALQAVIPALKARGLQFVALK